MLRKIDKLQKIEKVYVFFYFNPFNLQQTIGDGHFETSFSVVYGVNRKGIQIMPWIILPSYFQMTRSCTLTRRWKTLKNKSAELSNI